jgi:trimethylamine--corrinoid protein Co-methyltransferase
MMDMRTMTCSYGAPEMNLMTAAMTDLAHHYNLPMYGVACCSDSPSVDGQAAVEASVSALMSLLSGANLIHDVGLANHCTAVGPAMLVLADEIIAMTKRACQPISVGEDSLALDLIDRIGPAGNYLSDEHTAAHFREMWYSDLFVRTSDEGPQGGNKETLMQRTVSKMNRILQTHRPKRLSEKTSSELARMEEHWLT